MPVSAHTAARIDGRSGPTRRPHASTNRHGPPSGTLLGRPHRAARRSGPSPHRAGHLPERTRCAPPFQDGTPGPPRAPCHAHRRSSSATRRMARPLPTRCHSRTAGRDDSRYGSADAPRGKDQQPLSATVGWRTRPGGDPTRHDPDQDEVHIEHHAFPELAECPARTADSAPYAPRRLSAGTHRVQRPEEPASTRRVQAARDNCQYAPSVPAPRRLSAGTHRVQRPEEPASTRRVQTARDNCQYAPSVPAPETGRHVACGNVGRRPRFGSLPSSAACLPDAGGIAPAWRSTARLRPPPAPPPPGYRAGRAPPPPP